MELYFHSAISCHAIYVVQLSNHVDSMALEELCAYRLCKDTGLVTYVRVEGLQWVRHMVRMFDSRTPKQILDASVGGRKTSWNAEEQLGRRAKGCRQIAP